MGGHPASAMRAPAQVKPYAVLGEVRPAFATRRRAPQLSALAAASCLPAMCEEQRAPRAPRALRELAHGGAAAPLPAGRSIVRHGVNKAPFRVLTRLSRAHNDQRLVRPA
eukprot:563048-Prymnesium_polylepis.3